MKKFLPGLSLGLALGLLSARAAVLTVNTTNNTNPGAGELSLLRALQIAAAGDTIAFNIPGPGPHFIPTPAAGYPLIVRHNLTLDGYTQPGASRNSNPILSSNNAVLKIVLDSRAGGHRVMDFPPDSPNDDTGYSLTEAAILGVVGATNLTIRGLSFAGAPIVGAFFDTTLYSVAFAKGAQGHVNGCWFGVLPDASTLAGTFCGVTGFHYDRKNDTGTVTQSILTDGVVVGVARGASNAPAQFNVFTGVPGIPVIVEGNATRISGNFLGVFPDGRRDYNTALSPSLSGFSGGTIEIGRGGNNTVIGVDSDGVNDANERNLFGGLLPEAMGGYDHQIEFYQQSPGTNIVIAGNYFGLATDGVTRFTNGVAACNAAGAGAVIRFGSDLDGTADALEGNVVYNDWPYDLFTGPTSQAVPAFFDEINAGGIVSVRGNSLVNNFTPPVSPLRDGGVFITNYYAKAMLVTTDGFAPVLSPSSTTTRLIGTAPRPATAFPYAMVDVYLVDPEGITNGIAAAIPELPDGFLQGKTFLGSFVMDGPTDANPAPAAFDVNIASFGIAPGSQLTAAVNYSKDPPGTRNGRAVTSLFSEPVTVPLGAAADLVLNATLNGTTLSLSWSGGLPPYQLQVSSRLGAAWSNVGTASSATSTNITLPGPGSFYRVQGQ